MDDDDNDDVWMMNLAPRKNVINCNVASRRPTIYSDALAPAAVVPVRRYRSPIQLFIRARKFVIKIHVTYFCKHIFANFLSLILYSFFFQMEKNGGKSKFHFLFSNV